MEHQRLLPLAPAAFFILFALADGEKHGYAINHGCACCLASSATRVLLNARNLERLRRLAAELENDCVDVQIATDLQRFSSEADVVASAASILFQWPRLYPEYRLILKALLRLRPVAAPPKQDYETNPRHPPMEAPEALLPVTRNPITRNPSTCDRVTLEGS